MFSFNIVHSHPHQHHHSYLHASSYRSSDHRCEVSDGMRGQWSVAAASFGHIWASISGGCVHDDACKDQKMSFFSCAVRKNIQTSQPPKLIWSSWESKASPRRRAAVRRSDTRSRNRSLSHGKTVWTQVTRARPFHALKKNPNCWFNEGENVSHWSCHEGRCLIDTCWFVCVCVCLFFK